MDGSCASKEPEGMREKSVAEDREMNACTQREFGE